eukprot:sb/3461995/
MLLSSNFKIARNLISIQTQNSIIFATNYIRKLAQSLHWAKSGSNTVNFVYRGKLILSLNRGVTKSGVTKSGSDCTYYIFHLLIISCLFCPFETLYYSHICYPQILAELERVVKSSSPPLIAPLSFTPVLPTSTQRSPGIYDLMFGDISPELILGDDFEDQDVPLIVEEESVGTEHATPPPTLSSPDLTAQSPDNSLPLIKIEAPTPDFLLERRKSLGVPVINVEAPTPDSSEAIAADSSNSTDPSMESKSSITDPSFWDTTAMEKSEFFEEPNELEVKTVGKTHRLSFHGSPLLLNPQHFPSKIIHIRSKRKTLVRAFLVRKDFVLTPHVKRSDLPPDTVPLSCQHDHKISEGAIRSCSVHGVTGGEVICSCAEQGLYSKKLTKRRTIKVRFKRLDLRFLEIQDLNPLISRNLRSSRLKRTLVQIIWGIVGPRFTGPRFTATPIYREGKLPPMWEMTPPSIPVNRVSKPKGPILTEDPPPFTPGIIADDVEIPDNDIPGLVVEDLPPEMSKQKPVPTQQNQMPMEMYSPDQINKISNVLKAWPGQKTTKPAFQMGGSFFHSDSKESTDTSKQPIRTRHLGHVTVSKPKGPTLTEDPPPFTPGIIADDVEIPDLIPDNDIPGLVVEDLSPEMSKQKPVPTQQNQMPMEMYSPDQINKINNVLKAWPGQKTTKPAFQMGGSFFHSDSKESTDTSKQPIRTRHLGHVDWLSANQGPVFPDSVVYTLVTPLVTLFCIHIFSGDRVLSGKYLLSKGCLPLIEQFRPVIWGSHHPVSIISVPAIYLPKCSLPLRVTCSQPQLGNKREWFSMSGTNQEPTETRHVTGYQPIRDQYFLIRSVPGTNLEALFSEYSVSVLCAGQQLIDEFP